MLTRAALLAAKFEPGKRLEYNKGEYIVRPGEEISGVFFIKSGLVKSFHYTKFGEENLLSLRKSEEIIGLTASIADRNLNVMYSALAPTVLLFLTKESFLYQLESDPKLGLAIINTLGEMYRLHSEHILDLEYRSVRERLIAFLISARWRFGQKKANKIIIEIPLRHQDIASYINASRETTSRELNYLQRKGLIEFSQHLIVIKQFRKLRSYLDV